MPRVEAKFWHQLHPAYCTKSKMPWTFNSILFAVPLSNRKEMDCPQLEAKKLPSSCRSGFTKVQNARKTFSIWINICTPSHLRVYLDIFSLLFLYFLFTILSKQYYSYLENVTFLATNTNLTNTNLTYGIVLPYQFFIRTTLLFN